MRLNGFLFSCLMIVAGVLLLSMYTVDETSQVVLTRFGQVEGAPVLDAGLHMKVPFVDIVNSFPKALLGWDGERTEITTKNKMYIWVNAFAIWKITDPVLFLKKCESEAKATRIIGEIIDSSVKKTIASYDLIETVRNSNREFDDNVVGVGPTPEKMDNEKSGYPISVGREKISQEILGETKAKLEGYGIDLVDVKIKRINYRDDVQKSIYDKMIAERTQIAEKFRSEGRGDAQKINGDKEKELKRITSEAYKKAQMIKGEADAKVAKIYARAYGADPEFYSFVKSMDVYSQTLDKDSTLILSTDSEFLKYFNKRH